MRRPERADSSTARVAIEGARGATVNIERVGNAVAAVSAGISHYTSSSARCDVKFKGRAEPWHGASHLRQCGTGVDGIIVWNLAGRRITLIVTASCDWTIWKTKESCTNRIFDLQSPLAHGQQLYHFDTSIQPY
jgi:hypothetical protein